MGCGRGMLLHSAPIHTHSYRLGEETADFLGRGAMAGIRGDLSALKTHLNFESLPPSKVLPVATGWGHTCSSVRKQEAENCLSQ